MNKKVLFVLFAILMMAVMTVSVSADQIANDRWCNSDQYGCWITGDGGAQDYIMFWSESARDLIMGPGSNAVVTDPYPDGKMPLDPYPESPQRTIRPLTDAEKELIAKYAELVFTNADKIKYDSQEELKDAMIAFYTDNPGDLASDYNEDLTYYNRKNEVKDMDIDQKMALLADLYWDKVEYYQKNYNSRDAVLDVIKQSFDLYENSTDENKPFSNGNSYLDSNLAHFDITSYTNTNTSTNNNSTSNKPSDEELQRMSDEVSASEGKPMVCMSANNGQSIICRDAEDAAKYPYCTDDASSCFSTEEGLNDYLNNEANNQ